MSQAPYDAPYDEGLAAERTGLAWQRTAMAFAVASVAALKVLSSGGAATYVLAVLGLLFALSPGAAPPGRPPPPTCTLPGHDLHLPMGALVLVMSGSVLMLGAAAMVFILVDGIRGL